MDLLDLRSGSERTESLSREERGGMGGWIDRRMQDFAMMLSWTESISCGLV